MRTSKHQHSFVVSDNCAVPASELCSNVVNLSYYKQVDSPITFRNFSIKYVGCGTELYTVHNTQHPVTAGRYLLANYHAEGSVLIDSITNVRGVCIDISTDILTDATASYCSPDTPYPDITLGTFFTSSTFLENTYSAHSTRVGSLVQATDSLLQNRNINASFGEDFFFELADAIVADHISIHRSLKTIRAVRNSTKNDILRKLLRGKEYIEHYFYCAPDVASIARECGISEFHFYRLFKQAFGITPHKLLMQQRISFCINRLLSSSHDVSDIAIEAGFPDLPTFSKAFKSHTGKSPTAFRAHNHVY